MARVLIADEEPMLRLLLRLVLENDGHDVRDADSGREALIQIGSWQPDVVVTELALPGLDGADLVKRMRMRAPSVDMRIVGTSASVPADVELDGFFLKPYEAQMVAKEIDSMFGGQPDEAQGPAPRSTEDTLRTRTALLSDIWSRLVSVDSRTRVCDPECDIALEEIQRLATWIDERTARNQASLGGSEANDPDDYQVGLLGL